jgi:hypothetical protein
MVNGLNADWAALAASAGKHCPDNGVCGRVAQRSSVMPVPSAHRRARDAAIAPKGRELARVVRAKDRLVQLRVEHGRLSGSNARAWQLDILRAVSGADQHKAMTRLDQQTVRDAARPHSRQAWLASGLQLVSGAEHCTLQVADHMGVLCGCALDRRGDGRFRLGRSGYGLDGPKLERYRAKHLQREHGTA